MKEFFDHACVVRGVGRRMVVLKEAEIGVALWWVQRPFFAPFALEVDVRQFVWRRGREQGAVVARSGHARQ